jgi:ubiquinone/menaquinone biosynthesis C-methylase UbiE/uncharacterized protein YbaR (Trm112 family)
LVLETLLRCPACRSTLAESQERERTGFKCEGCGAVYPVRGCMIDLLPQSRPQFSLAQAAMQSPLVVSIYESLLWRRSPFFAAAARISFDREREMVFSAAELQGAEIVLDLACGTGIYSRPLARRLAAGGVIGIDLSLPMLRFAEKCASRDGINNLLLVHADAKVLPIASDSLDAAICCGALHLFPEPAASLASINDSLKPGRRVVLGVFRRNETNAAKFYSRLRRKFYGVSSFSSPELESMLVSAGFCDVQVHHAKGIWLIVSAKKAGTPH